MGRLNAPPTQLSGKQLIQFIGGNMDIGAFSVYALPNRQDALAPARGAANHHKGAAAQRRHLFL